jgi:multiple sugar transport system permease protein
MSRRKWKKWMVGYMYLLPSVIFLAIFTIFPVFASFFISLTQWTLINPPKFIGLENYKNLFSDPTFYWTLWHTVYYTLGSVPLSIILSLLLAIAMNQRIKGITIFRSMYFLPVISTWVAVAIVWRWIYNPQFGLLSAFLGIFGISPKNWLGDTRLAMPSVIITSVWKGLGYNMILFLAGFQNISESYYEAAKIDGASRWAQFRYITIPLISPTTFFVLITSVISSFQVFGPIYTMTNGGPVGSTEVLIFYLFQNGFRWYKMGYASSIAWVLFLIIFIFTLIQYFSSKRWVHYGA